VLLYDLTSTYFEGAMGENPKAKYGHSRDKRTDCLQVVIALVITTDGFPLAYEVMDGNTSDRTTLRGFLDKIEKTYGKAKRMWVMDRGIPTEEILQEMRDPAREIFYLVGTPKAKIQQYEKKWLDLPWQKVRDSNLIERWFGELTSKRVRRGSFFSVDDLQRAITDFLNAWNEEPKPFVWTATVESIQAKLSRCRQTLEQIQPGCTKPRTRKRPNRLSS